MISNLPIELEEEILSRVPLKSMNTLRSTCKKWNDLSMSFTKMHMAKAAAKREGESIMIAIINYNLYLMNVVVDHVDPSIELKGKLSCLEEQVKISKVFHCEGLLLCIYEDGSRLVVWNPYLGQTRWIDPRYSHRSNGWDKFSYALGYEDKKSCRSFKLLRFTDYWYKEPENQFLWYEIYDFDSGLWITLDVTPHWIVFATLGVSLKGNTYWCASERSSHNEYGFIICFDFTTERFGPLLPMPFIARYSIDYVTLSCVREEKLAVLLQHNEANPYELDIWISTKIDEANEVSWIKFLRVETEFDIYVPFLSGGFIIDEEKKVAIGFDEDDRRMVDIIGEAGYLRELEILPEHAYSDYTRHVCTYVPSLVQIKQPPGSGRKQQSDLEKRRFDENMLRLAAFEANT